jgi:hypothetical protein
MAQPAERMSSVPSTKIATMIQDGAPEVAIHSAVSVGQSRSSVPIGLSSRISRS